MGSSGTGNLSDYSGGGSGTGGGGQGGSSGHDRCETSIEEQLEEVAVSPYMTSHGGVPPVGTPVSLKLGKRLEVMDAIGTVIGFLPTQYHYLIQCIGQGFVYDGSVIKSAAGAVPAVLVSLSAHK
jgi:hypothetical protein